MFYSACPAGSYGAGCSNKCDCANSAECDHKTGDCLCPAGWTGRRCDQSKYKLNKQENIILGLPS